jgi:cation diffusion facilitator family transporter
MEERRTKSLKAVKIGIASNILLAIFKVILGIFAHSIALISDGVDTSIDVLKSFIVYQGIKIAAEPPDSSHPYGHGRAETIASNIIGISIIFAGIIIIIESLRTFGKTNAIESLMLIGAGASILGKIMLSAYMARMGKKFSNQALLANAKDYLGDVLSSSAVVIGGILIMITGRKFFDGIASISVASIIVYMGFKVLQPGFQEIMEEQDNPEIAGKIGQIINKFPEAINPHLIRMSKLGSYYIVDMHLEFSESMSIKESHGIVSMIEKEVKSKIPEIQDITIHVEPFENK